MPHPPPELQRFGVSLEPELLERFDAVLEEQGYASRSAALRDLIRGHLVERETLRGEETQFGTLTLVYDHHQRALSERLADLQHDHHSTVISTLHVHIDHDHCLEVIAMKGPGRLLQEMTDRLLSLEGVLHGRLTLTQVTPHRRRRSRASS